MSLKEKLKKAKEEIELLKEKNKQLQDEVDSLWAMMDEMTKSDMENWTHLLDELETDILLKSLMVTKKKGLA
jgi:vacuolar-type H+-ATPase subunit D/Vma8